MSRAYNFEVVEGANKLRGEFETVEQAQRFADAIDPEQRTAVIVKLPNGETVSRGEGGSELRRLHEQDAVHWKTRRALLRTIEAMRVSAQSAIDTIVRVEFRCMASDGPVTPTLKEMREEELSEIYRALKRVTSQSSEAAQ